MPKIDATLLNKMFKFCGVDKEQLYESLRTMGPSELKPELRAEWSKENPTRNFCYVIAEFVYCYMAPKNSQAYRVAIPGDSYEHYFVRWPNGTIVDLAAEQFPDHSVVDYAGAKKTKFMHPSPSRRARRLAELMEIDPEEMEEIRAKSLKIS